MKTILSIFGILLIAGVFLSACGSGESSGPPSGSQLEVNVVAARARVESLPDQVSVVGTLAANEEVEIQSEIDGIVERISFEEGQRVSKGMLLVEIDKQKLAAAFSETEADFKLAQANLRRSESLAEKKTISSQEYDQALAQYQVRAAALEIAKQRLSDASIIAPFDGITGARLVSPGQFVTTGMNLTFLVNVDPIKAEFGVAERFLGELKEGAAVSVSVDAFPGRAFEGSVYFISPRIDPKTRTALVKAKFANPDCLLRPGMFAKINVTLGSKLDVVLVPETAVIMQGVRTIVYSVGEDAAATPRDVELGLIRKGLVQIRSGLKAGELVVTEGTQKIFPGVKLKYSLAETSEVQEEASGG